VTAAREKFAQEKKAAAAATAFAEQFDSKDQRERWFQIAFSDGVESAAAQYEKEQGAKYEQGAKSPASPAPAKSSKGRK